MASANNRPGAPARTKGVQRSLEQSVLLLAIMAVIVVTAWTRTGTPAPPSPIAPA